MAPTIGIAGPHGRICPTRVWWVNVASMARFLQARLRQDAVHVLQPEGCVARCTFPDHGWPCSYVYLLLCYWGVATWKVQLYSGGRRCPLGGLGARSSMRMRIRMRRKAPGHLPALRGVVGRCGNPARGTCI